MKIRLWQLGSLEHQIAPTCAGAQKLADILDSHKSDEPFDLIWGPDLEVKIIDDADVDIVVPLNEEDAKKFLELKGYKVTKRGFFKGI